MWAPGRGKAEVGRGLGSPVGGVWGTSWVWAPAFKGRTTSGEPRGTHCSLKGTQTLQAGNT